MAETEAAKKDGNAVPRAEGAKSESTPASPQVGTRYSAEEIHENVRKAAEEELERPASELVWSALASGLLLGFSFLAVGFLRSLVPPAYHAAATAVAYPLGFLYVVHGRHQLFTENTLYPVVVILEERRGVVATLRLWSIILVANVAGATLFALVIAHTAAVPASIRSDPRS